MNLVIYTQDYEKYGDRWKPKGGSEYIVEDFFLEKSGDVVEEAERQVEIVAQMVSISNEMCQSDVIDWSIESEDYLPWFERMQLEFDGEIESFESRVCPDARTIKRRFKSYRDGKIYETLIKVGKDGSRDAIYSNREVAA